jgi:hypothetical protein
LLSRNHESIIETSNKYYDGTDFTIQPDENSKNLGGRGVWVGHALPVIPQNKFYLENTFYEDLHKNSDYIFTFSEEWKEWHKIHNLPTYNVGVPKLDTLFDNIEGGSILFAPTHSGKPNVYSADKVDVSRLANYGYDVIVRGHPAFYDNEISLEDSFKKSSIVISDYSSIGLEAIILNIPTILVGDETWKDYENNHISGKADEAVIRVYNQEELEKAILIYKDNPKYLEEERLKYSNILCDYQGNSSKIFVDTLESLI